MSTNLSEEQILQPQLSFDENFDTISLLADAMPQLVWLANADGNVFYYNNRVQEFAGARKEASGTWSWEGLLHPEDVETTSRAWKDAVLQDKIYEIEHRVKLRNGSYRWHLSRAYPQFNKEKKVVRWFGTATDIHEQKLVEETIKEAEERWRTALEATEIGTWEFNPHTKEFYLSDVAKKIRGFVTEMEKPILLHRESIHPDDVNEVANAMEKAVRNRTEESFEMLYRVTKQNAEGWFWIRSIGRVINDKYGEPQRVIGILQDITEQKLAEEKLQYLAALTVNIADAVIGTDLDNNITNWNTGAENIYGWSKDEVMGKKAKDILHNRFLSASDEKNWFEQFQTKGQWQGEVIQKRKNGQDIIVLASIAKVLNAHGQHIGGVGVNKDITTQRKAAELLKESEERFRILTNTIPQIVSIYNTNGEPEYLNDQWFYITGQKIDEAFKNGYELVHADDVDALLQKWESALNSGQSFNAEYRIKNIHSNQYRWFFSNVEPLKDKDGNVLKWISAASDIQHFKDLSVLLEHQVQERTMELNRLNQMLKKQTEELRRSNEDLQQFAHVASHDLKEPLRKIKTYSSRLNDEFGNMLPERALLFLEKMDSAASRMSSMIDGVLRYSMLGATEQIIESIDLNDIIHQIEMDLEVIIQQKKATIEYRDLMKLEGSAILIYQLFYNLVNNSLKFSKKDELPVIRISSSVVNGKDLKKQYKALGDQPYIRILVEDNGIGFDQEHAEKIFKTFTRLNAKDKFEGTGLGLSLCKKIVQRHNGIIEAKGILHKGAAFTVVIPVRQTF